LSLPSAEKLETTSAPVVRPQIWRFRTSTLLVSTSRRLISLRLDGEYGWEKLFSERICLAYQRNYGIQARVARYDNMFGQQGTWRGGREKAPAAICRKVAEVKNGGSIEIWGDGNQTRSFLFIDECTEGTTRLTRSNFSGPVNIGSDEMVTVISGRCMAGDPVRGEPVSGAQFPGGREKCREIAESPAIPAWWSTVNF
jgi:GDP-D-mannose 3', 5'-epimerase